jgi:hypothetical protein
MKRTALSLTLILVIVISTIEGAKLVNWATANPYPYTNCDSSFVTVSVLSPENKTYDTNSILVAIFAGAYPGVWGVSYSLDGGPLTDLAPGKWNGHIFNESVWLNRLSKGSHNIVAEAVAPASDKMLTAYNQVYFTINKEIKPPDITAPEITIVSPQNKTYYETPIPLDFSVNEPNCRISYKFDTQELVEISTNTTLIGFYYGPHNLTIYATDLVGNTGVKTVIFTLGKFWETTPSPEPCPTTPAVASIVLVTVVGAGLLVYFKKCKRKT